MGLDITLGTLIFLSAVRGWFKGFLRQGITLGSLVGCVYLADPLRELARPYARSYLPAVAPDILDCLLWWGLAVASYLVNSGIALTILKSTKKRTYGDPEPNRTDQGAGFVLGGLKGFIVASFVVAAVSRFAPGYLKPGGFADDQTKTSKGLAWAEQYQPAEKMWSSPPVQAFVSRIKQRGLWSAPADKKKPAEEVEEVETAKPAMSQPDRTASISPKTLSVPTPEETAEMFQKRVDEFLKREVRDRR